MLKTTICVLIVTRNRLKKLMSCLQALEHQTVLPDKVFVVDNASSDGTQEFFADRPLFPFSLEYARLHENCGGAGGFSHALSLFLHSEEEAAWIMDDDSIPKANALEELLKALHQCKLNGKNPVVLASFVEWHDGKPHPWNIPYLRYKKNVYSVYHKDYDVIPIRAASFVSIVIQRDAVKKYGLPISSYFIYNDDIEYTGRILRHEYGVLVPSSRCLHDTPQESLRFLLLPERLYFEIRNKIWMILFSPAWNASERFRYFCILGKNIILHLPQCIKFQGTVRAILRGVWDGLRTRP